MKIVVFLSLFFVSAASSSAFALEPCDISHADVRGAYDLGKFINVSIIGKDDRVGISNHYAQTGLSDDEYHQTLTSSGAMVCPDSDGHLYVSGAVITKGKDIVATNSHIFIDSNGKQYRRMDLCYFINYAHPKNQYSISMAFGDTNIGNSPQNLHYVAGDYAVVRLVKEVKESTPYEVDQNQTPMKYHENLTVISNTYNGSRLGPEPNIQSCLVTKTYRGNEQGQKAYKTDCDSLPGDSAALNLTRGLDGKLSLRGLTYGDLPGAKERCPNYDDDTCANLSVQLTGPVLDTIQRLSEEKPSSTSSAKIPEPNEQL